MALALAGWLVIERYRAKAALVRYEQDLIAKGEKLDFAELVSPIPEGENGSFEFQQLCKSFQDGSTLLLNAPPAMRHVAPGKSLVIATQPGWFAGKETVRWEDAHDDLQRNANTLAEIRKISRSAVLHSAIEYRGINTRLGNRTSYRAAAQWLSASALYNLHVGDIKAATDDVETIVIISRPSADEPMLFSQLSRNAVVSLAVYDSWPVLQMENISEEQLHRLQGILQDVDFVTPMVHAVRGERVIGRDTIQMLRSTDTTFEELVDTLFSAREDDEATGVMKKVPYNRNIRNAIRAGVIAPLWRFAWSYADERHMLEEAQTVLAAAENARAQRSRSPLNIVAKSIEAKSSGSWQYWVTDLFLSTMAKAPAGAFRFQAHNEMTITAIALKRYHLRHGKYPQTLDQLVPEFLKTHPVDWMDGQKLRYRPEDASFVLWSVGDNGIDDGGTPDQTEPYNFWNGPDFVWPRPASTAEVEQYYERMKTRP